MSRAYQVVEPRELSELCAAPGSVEIAVAILTWVVEQVAASLAAELGEAQIEVIRVEYHGAYPGIGIHYPIETGVDVGPLVERAISEILRTRSIVEFVRDLAVSGASWRGVTEKLMRPDGR
jgi:hypothetical protein